MGPVASSKKCRCNCSCSCKCNCKYKCKRIATIIQDAWNKLISHHHWFGIRLTDTAFLMAVISLTLGLCCLICGLSMSTSTAMVYGTCVGAHQIAIAVALTALLRWPGRRMSAFSLSNCIFHSILVGIAICVDSITLASLFLSQPSPATGCPSTAASSQAHRRSHVISADGNSFIRGTMLLCFEIICLAVALAELVAGFRYRRYIIACQRYDLSRASRDEVETVFMAENHPSLPWPPFTPECRIGQLTRSLRIRRKEVNL